MATKKKCIDIATLAKLALDVYDVEGGKVQAGDWKPWNLFGERMHKGLQIGFFARVYFSSSSKELIVAIRGTAGTEGRIGNVGTYVNILDGVNDVITDIYQFGPSAMVNNLTQQMNDALQFIKIVKDYSGCSIYNLIGITGHSLGGGLSAICALEHKISCVTFNPAPIDSWLYKKGRDFYGDNETFKYVTNVIAPNDPVSALNNISSKFLFNMKTEWAVPGYTIKVGQVTGHSMVALANTLDTDKAGKIRPFL